MGQLLKEIWAKLNEAFKSSKLRWLRVTIKASIIVVGILSFFILYALPLESSLIYTLLFILMAPAVWLISPKVSTDEQGHNGIGGSGGGGAGTDGPNGSGHGSSHGGHSGGGGHGGHGGHGGGGGGHGGH